ncbi:MAG: Tyrosine--tRNA ligase [Methanobacteriota archaeon]|nr:tyrosine--tRNA ligase [Euryarchaeota archaeon]CAI8208374.1 MAG: Tyrosine--tRNA ligase [Euryarchaeota archaeon]
MSSAEEWISAANGSDDLDATSRNRLVTMLGGVEEAVGLDHLIGIMNGGPTHSGSDVIRCYVGFEPSGKAHIGWKVIANLLRRLLDAETNVLVFLADWHAWINDKFGGDMDSIQLTADYMEDVFRALLDHPDEGDGAGQLRFLRASELMENPDYWARMLRCAKNQSLNRVRRTFSIMGRSEDSSDGDLSKFFYPAMQAADIFELGIDIAIGGMDQRKAHMYMRGVADSHGWTKATCLHTPILSGLKTSGARMESFDHKMSKSDPSGAILLHDGAKKLKKKINGAYFDPNDTESPVYELIEHVILPEFGILEVRPNPKYGEPSDWTELSDIRNAISAGTLHPLDLKIAVAEMLYQGLSKVSGYFETHPDNLRAVEKLLNL